MKRTIAFASLIATCLWAQEMTTDMVLKLAKADFREEHILNFIRQNKGCYSLSTKDLTELKDNGLSEKVIEEMMLKRLECQGYKITPPATAAPAQPAAANVKLAGGGGGGGGSPAPAAPSPEAAKPKPPPDKAEPGILYRKDKDNWAEVISEPVTWSEKGMVKNIKHVASFTLLKKPVVGTITGPHSRTIIPTPAEVVVVLPPETSIHDFLLLPLDSQKKVRKVEVGPASEDKKNAASRGISFGLDKVQGNQYKVVLPGGLQPGEYGVVNLKTIGRDAMGKIFTFRVIPTT